MPSYEITGATRWSVTGNKWSDSVGGFAKDMTVDLEQSKTGPEAEDFEQSWISRRKRMKKLRLEGWIFGAATLFGSTVLAQIPAAGSSAAQNQMSGQMASASPTDLSTNASAGVDTQLMKDRIFVHKMTDGGFAEAHFGQLAVQKASSDDVKKLGQKMVDDHTALDNNMKPVADELGVRAPSKLAKEDQEEFDKLSALSGSAFEKEYLAYTLRSQRMDLHEFRMEIAQTNDPLIRDTISGVQPIVVGHLYMVNKLALENGVPSAHKPAESAPPAPPR